MNYINYLKAVTSCPLCNDDDLIITSTEFHNIVAAKAPYSKNHCMVVPHDHIISILDYSDEMMQDLIAAQMQLTRYLYAQ
jgi:diadenosine tetraphosphate (Ap4A) HIT family hydrolase